jgi:hypothetical protein
MPELKIAIGRWGRSIPDKHRAALREMGASYIGQSPAETIEHVQSLTRLQPVPEPERPVPQAVAGGN